MIGIERGSQFRARPEVLQPRALSHRVCPIKPPETPMMLPEALAESVCGSVIRLILT